MRTIDGSEVPSKQHLPSCSFTRSTSRDRILQALQRNIQVLADRARKAVEASDEPRWTNEARAYAQAVVQFLVPQVFWAMEEEKLTFADGMEKLKVEEKAWMKSCTSQDTYAKACVAFSSPLPRTSSPIPAPSLPPQKPSSSEASKPATSSDGSWLMSASKGDLSVLRSSSRRTVKASPARPSLQPGLDAVETASPSKPAPLPLSTPAAAPVHPPPTSSQPPRSTKVTAPNPTEAKRTPSILSAHTSTASGRAEKPDRRRRPESLTPPSTRATTTRAPSPVASDTATAGTKRGRRRRRRRRRRQQRDPNATTDSSSSPSSKSSTGSSKSYASVAAMAARLLGPSFRNCAILLLPLQ